MFADSYFYLRVSSGNIYSSNQIAFLVPLPDSSSNYSAFDACVYLCVCSGVAQIFQGGGGGGWWGGGGKGALGSIHDFFLWSILYHIKQEFLCVGRGGSRGTGNCEGMCPPASLPITTPLCVYVRKLVLLSTTLYVLNYRYQGWPVLRVCTSLSHL